MKIDTTFLRSKVARRIFILFICCALLPVTVLSVVSFSHITKQLSDQSKIKLHQMSKDIGMYSYERLLFIEAELKRLAEDMNSYRRSIITAPHERSDRDLVRLFKGIVLINNTGTIRSLFGRIHPIPELNLSEKQHLRSGKTVVSTIYLTSDASRIFMSMALDPQQPRKGILLGEINPTYLWGMGDTSPWPPTAELYILDQANNILFSTLPPPLSFPQEAVHTLDTTASGQFEWKHKKTHYLAGYWSLFLKPRYYTPKWTIVMSESKADALAPAATFKKIFPLIILMTIWVVVLLSIVQIRRNLIPLESLQEGTKQIAQGNFDNRVIIKTGDEFEELAASFNIMAERLGKQLRTLTALTEIDRSILSALDTDKIIEIVLNRIHDILPCDCVSVMLFYITDQNLAVTYIREKGTKIGKEVETILLAPEEIKEMYLNPEFFATVPSHPVPHYLIPLAKHGMKSFVILPLFIKQILSGIITLGFRQPPMRDEETIAQARQVADQVAVALSNTRLIEELKQLHLGTLTALARAIDAKSSWTAGHSERVTKLALKIGGSLGLSPEELDILNRGGLLHDIGKIGVPADILNKTGKLNNMEEDLVREHVRLGVRILEPIAAFEAITPIVLHHHERFDGSGYPDGLIGEAISLNARIFAVADTFDALTSHRPYRHAEEREQALEIITRGAGTEFDPKIVQALLEVMKKERKKTNTKRNI